MKYVYSFSRLPKDKKMVKNINSAAERLSDKLVNLDLNSLNISDYSKRYLGKHTKNIRSSLQKYSFLLSWALSSTNIPLSKFVFIDYGGGSGILSLLAKELMIGTVIYNDIYDVSCSDAKVIAKSINSKADYYVQGDIDELIVFLKTKSLSCNSMVSFDVIEHIYDIEGFFTKLQYLSKGWLSIVLATGANECNFIIRRSLVKKHVHIEFCDRQKVKGHKERDCLKAYFKVRQEIIQKHSPELSKQEVEKLSMSTRGLIESDIKKAIDHYKKTKQFPPGPTHPTNTCDPYTGNWAEHLMDPYMIIKLLSKSGFKVKLFAGYYGQNVNIIKKLFIIFNPLIMLLGKYGIRVAPFFTIYAKNVNGIGRKFDAKKHN